MSRSHLSNSITVDEQPMHDGVVNSFQGILGAYNALGFERGYARATDNLLASIPMLVEEFNREHIGVSFRDRQVLKAFARFLEERLAGASNDNR